MLHGPRRTDDEETTIRELRAEVERLEVKLAELHSSDVNALRRANQTLTDHIQALRLEAQALWPLLRDVEQEVISPEFVAAELTAAGIIATNAAALHQLLDLTTLPAGRRSHIKLLLLGAAVAGFGWRLVVRVVRRTVEVVRLQSRARRRLLQEWRTVLDRIEIMTALVEWQPAWEEEPEEEAQVAGTQPLQPQQQPLSAVAHQGGPCHLPGHHFPLGPRCGQQQQQQQQQGQQQRRQQQQRPAMHYDSGPDADAEPSAPAWPG